MRAFLLLILLVPAGFAQDDEEKIKGLEARAERLTARMAEQQARASRLATELEQATARLAEAVALNRELASRVDELSGLVEKARELTGRQTDAVRKMSTLLAKSNLLTTVKLLTAYLPTRVRAYERQFGAAPPPTIRELVASDKRFGSLEIGGNRTNESAETLLAALRRPDFLCRAGADSPVLIGLCNTDRDRFNKPPAGSRSIDASELADAWGNPVVYIPAARYGEPIPVVTAKGRRVEVFARKRSDGTYYNPSTYQLISLGQNGVPDVPGSREYDDVTNFAWK